MAYTFKTSRQFVMEFEGNTVHFDAGVPFATDDPCRMLRFIAAFQGATGEGVTEEWSGVLNELRAGCASAGGGAAPLTPNPVDSSLPPVEKKPTAGDSLLQQGAPDAEASGSVDGRLPEAQLSPWQLLESFWGRGGPPSPRPVEELVSLVNQAPANATDYNEMVRRTLTNAPLPRQPDSSAKPFARHPTTAGEPVDLFTGAFVIGLCDLTVPTPHIPIAMTRSYRSGRPYFGPFGYGWDHTYNVYLRELEGGAFALWTGQLREVHFTVTGASLEPDPGFAARLEPLAGVTGVYDLQFPGGLSWRFERPAGWTHAERIPLTLITDRHGNQVRLAYNSINAVSSVMDAAGRGLFFSYGSCDLLEQVTDHTASRIVRYVHDPEIEHLIGVVLPSTAQYPDGIRTSYDYDSYNPHPAMQHNILRIHDAQDRVTVENEFAGPEDGWEFNAVVRQRTAGFEYQFEYQQIQFVWPDVLNADVLASRTMIRSPDGCLHTYTFNYRGDLLDHRLRLSRDGSYRVVASQWRHDAEGNITEAVAPDGVRTVFTFDASNPDPCARRNLLRVELVSPFPDIVASRVVFQARYDAQYQLIVETTDEAVARTRYQYDFDLAPVGATGRLTQIQLAPVVLPDGTPQASVLSYEHNAQGQLTVAMTAEGVRTQLTYISAGAQKGLLATLAVDPGGANLITALDYDAFGFALSLTAPGARVTGFRYNGLGQLEEVRAPTIAGEDAALRRWFDDSGGVVRVERPAGSYAGLLEGVAIVDEYLRNQVGHLRGTVLAANTIDRRAWRQCVDHEGRAVSIHDPLDVQTRRCYAETGWLLKETVGADTGDAQTASYTYDRAGRMTRIATGTGVQTQVQYDIWGRPHKIVLPSGAVRTLEYGVNDVLLEERADDSSGTSPIKLQHQRFEYDRRGRLVALTLFSFADSSAAEVPLTTRYLYDKDDQLRAIWTPRGARHAFDYDSTGRPSAETDVHGNLRRFAYDVAGDLTEVTLIDTVGTTTRTRASRFTYDARGRLEKTEFLDEVSAFEYDDRDLAIAQSMPTGVVKKVEFNAHGQVTGSVVDPLGLALRSAYDYDQVGRMQRFTDPMGRVTSWDRDALGRSTVLKLPDGTVWKYAVDKATRTAREATPSGNFVQRQVLDAGGRLLRITATPAPGQHSMPPLDYSFDGLGRLVEATSGANQVQRGYDSLDRLISESARGQVVRREYDDATGDEDLIYPDGRRVRTQHNPAGQPTQTVLVTPGPLGGASGDVLLEIVYGTSGLPERVLYGNGVETQLARDDHDRLIRVDHRSGAALLDSCRLRYDQQGHHAFVQYLGAPMRNLLHTFDANDRLIEVRSGFAVPALTDAAAPAAQMVDIGAARAAAASAPGVAFDLDDADARKQAVGVNSAAPTLFYVRGADHRLLTAGTQTWSYNLDGHRIQDARYQYELDALNRVTRLRDAATTTVVAELTYDALGRVASGAIDGAPFERWFADTTRVQEISGLGAGVEKQHFAHPLWPAPFAVLDAAGLGYIQQDPCGSTACITDGGGAVLERHRYDTFGVRATFAADGTTPLVALKTEAIWRGMPALGSTPLYRTPHRLYDPETGEFTSRDPLLYADSPSPYAYAAHNPADYADPSGLAKSPVARPSTPARTVEQPTLGDRILDGLGDLPGSPLGLRNAFKKVVAMADAFNEEKSLGDGVVMALNVLNPLYHALASTFEASEASDRGDTDKAVTYGVQAAMGYVQTLAMAAGVARGVVRLSAPRLPTVTPPSQGLARPPTGGFRITVAEGKPVVQLPALNVEMNTAARTMAEAPMAMAELPEAVRGGGTWAVAEGMPPVRSGFAYPGYEGNLAAELFEHAKTNGIELRPHGFFDRLPNLGAPGAWASTHAELKVVFRNIHVQFVEVNRAMCKGCQGSICQIVMQRGMPVVVLDPNGFWYFTSEGVMHPPQ